MDRRTLLAVVLSLLVVLGYTTLMSRLYPPPPPGEEERGEEVAVSPPSPAAPVESEPQAPALMAGAAAIPPTDVEETGVEMANEIVSLTFGNRTGGLRSVRLTRHLDEEGQPQELIRSDARVYSGQLLGADRKQLSVVDVQVGKGRLDLSFEGGTRVTWTLPQGSYAPQLEVQGVGAEHLTMVGPAGFSDHILATRYYGNRGFAYAGPDGDDETQPFKKLKQGRVVEGPIDWVVSEDKYFLQGWLPEAPVRSVEFLVGGDEEYAALLPVPVGRSIYRVYLGPKEMDSLAATSPVLEGRIHFGWFRVVAEPMFYVLRWFHKLVGSWGVAIILVTLLVKLIFFKLTHSQQVSMKKMQALQPEMTALREKFKKDPQRMQREIMDLYKRHKVNPMMGCLPMLVQIPVFIALYNVLLNTIELRHTPFLYLRDLAAPDALFGQIAGFSIGPLPLVMGLTMWIQQQMTPTTLDPTQARVMKALPIVFTLMFLNFPSGLVLYWTVNNILTVGQQAIVNRG